MKRYLLDTNVASHIIRGDDTAIIARLAQTPMHEVTISVITEAELRYGLAKRGNPAGLTARVQEFLIRVEILPWTREVANVYGELRAACETTGTTLAPLDMMIAAHAKATGAILVTRDRAFSRIPGALPQEDWKSN